MDGEFGRIVSVRVFVAAWIAIWSGCVCLDFGNFPVAISAPPVVAVARHVQCHFALFAVSRDIGVLQVGYIRAFRSCFG